MYCYPSCLIFIFVWFKCICPQDQKYAITSSKARFLEQDDDETFVKKWFELLNRALSTNVVWLTTRMWTWWAHTRLQRHFGSHTPLPQVQLGSTLLFFYSTGAFPWLDVLYHYVYELYADAGPLFWIFCFSHCRDVQNAIFVCLYVHTYIHINTCVNIYGATYTKD